MGTEAPFERDLRFVLLTSNASLDCSVFSSKIVSHPILFLASLYFSAASVDCVFNPSWWHLWCRGCWGRNCRARSHYWTLYSTSLGKLIEVSSDRTNDLKIALIERNSLKTSKLSGPPGNRCSSLTPGSVRFLQGTWSSYLYLPQILAHGNIFKRIEYKLIMICKYCL